MNPFRAIGRVFGRVGRVIRTALRFAESRGLTDELVDLALKHVVKAQESFDTNEGRRAYVLSQLRGYGVPESIARLALELAVSAYKKQVQP